MNRRDSCLLGCGVAGVVALLALFGAAKFFQHGSDWLKAKVQRIQAWNNLDQTWRAPVGLTNAAAWFPTNLVGAVLERSGEGVEVPWLDLTGPGWHAHYRLGERSFDLYVLEIQPGQGEKIQEQVGQAVNDFKSSAAGGTTRLQTRIHHYSSYRVSPPLEQGALWWHSPYLFLVRSPDDAELKEVLWSYLRMMDGRRP